MKRVTVRILALTPFAVFAFLACSVGPLFAQGPPTQTASATKRLTLDEAKVLALKNSVGVKLGELNVSAQTEATAAQKKDYLPKVALDYFYVRLSEPLGDVLQAGSIGPISVNIIGQNINLAAVTAAQPITQLWTIKAAVQAAKADEDIAKAKLDGGKRDLSHAVTRLYYGLFGAQAQQSAAQLQVSDAEQDVRTQNTTDANIALLEARESLSKASSQVAQLSFTLNGLVGFDPGTRLELTQPPPTQPPVKSVEEAISQAIANSPEIAEARHTISKAAAGLRVANLAYVPGVAVFAGYAYLDGVDILTQHSFGYAGVEASISLFEWGKKGRLKNKSAFQHRMATNNLAMTEGEIAVAAQTAYWNFTEAGDAVRLKKEIVEQRKSASQQSPTDATATAAQKKAELDLMKAELEYSLARADLEKAISGTK